MSLLFPQRPDVDPARGNALPMLRRLCDAVKVASITLLGGAAGCETPAHQSPGKPLTPVVRTIEKQAPDVRIETETVYVSDPTQVFDVSVTHSPAEAPRLAVRHGKVQNPLPMRGSSEENGIATSSFRIEPPKGGWTAKDNGVHDIVLLYGMSKEAALSKFTVDIAGPQGDDSARLLRCTRSPNGNALSLRFRAATGMLVDARSLMRSGVVLRSADGKDVRMKLQPTPGLRDDEEITIDASSSVVPAGTYDIVVMNDIATSSGRIPAGTISTLRLP